MTGRRSTATRRPFDPAEVLSRLSGGRRAGRLVHVHVVPARREQVLPWPDWVSPSVYSAVNSSGIPDLWSHQREAADWAHDGTHVVISTGPASGNSLGSLLPLLSAVADGAAAPSGRAPPPLSVCGARTPGGRGRGRAGGRAFAVAQSRAELGPMPLIPGGDDLREPSISQGGEVGRTDGMIFLWLSDGDC